MEENGNLSNNLASYKDEKPLLKKLNIEKNNINEVSKSLDNENFTRNMMSEFIPQIELFEHQLLLFLTEVQFGD